MPSHTLLLYDPSATPSTWCERMAPGEFAVHASNRATCEVFPSLLEAETFAAAEVAATLTLRCRIYDHHGFIGAPLRELSGKDFRDSSHISQRYLTLLGLTLLVVGVTLFTIDWTHDFRFGWPGFIGARLLIFGLIVTAIAGLSLLHELQKARAER